MNHALVDIIDVQVLHKYNLFLMFDDGAQGSVDISSLISFEGIFEPLRDTAFFASVSINSDIGTICWENGADLSPNYLRQHIQHSEHTDSPAER